MLCAPAKPASSVTASVTRMSLLPTVAALPAASIEHCELAIRPAPPSDIGSDHASPPSFASRTALAAASYATQQLPPPTRSPPISASTEASRGACAAAEADSVTMRERPDPADTADATAGASDAVTIQVPSGCQPLVSPA